MEPLKRTKNFTGPDGPVVLTILDGIGISQYEEGNIVRKANTHWIGYPATASHLI